MPLDFATSKQPETGFSFAGLTDIVLLLLIFFLLTSNFIPQVGIQVDLPQADAASPADADHVVVAITGEGTYYVNADQVEEAQLQSAIREARGDRAELVLRADQNATVAQFATVASVARSLDMRVLMATDQEMVTPPE